MQRLLEDATAISGIEYDLDSYADIVDAIHVIQTELGITGTTALEASTTISGTFSSLKASIKNLLTGFASKDEGIYSLNELVAQVIESVTTYGENVLPRVETIFSNVKSTLETNIDSISAKIGDFSQEIAKNAPDAISKGFSIVDTIVAGFTANSADTRAAGEAIIKSIASGISQSVDYMEPSASDIIGGLANGFITYKSLAMDIGLKLIEYTATGIYDNLDHIESEAKTALDKFIAGVTNEEKLKDLSRKGAVIVKKIGQGIADASGELFGAALDVILAFGEGLVEEDAGVELTRSAGKVIENFVGAFTPERLQKALEVGGEILNQIIEGVSGGNETEGAFSKIAKAGLKVITNLGNGIAENAPSMTDKAGELIENFVGWFGEEENLKTLDTAAAAIVKGAFALTTSGIKTIKGWASDAVDKIVEWFEGTTAEEKFEAVAKVVGAIWSSEFVQAVKEGLGDLWEVLGLDWVSDPIAEIAKNTKTNIIDPIAEFLDPANKMLSDIGGKISTNAGLEQGTSFYAGSGMLAVKKSEESESQNGGKTNGGGAGRNSTINVTQNIYAKAQTPSELMREAKYRAEEAVLFAP